MSNSDETFRIVLIIGAVLLFPAGIYYRFKSQSTGEALDRRQEGLAILLTLRPIGLAGAIGLIAFMVNPSSMAWSLSPCLIGLDGRVWFRRYRRSVVSLDISHTWPQPN